MKQLKLFGCLLGTAIAVIASAAPLPVSWAEGLNKAANFQHNASGSLKFTDDVTANAVRIDATFKPNVDRWAYPFLRFPAGRSLAGIEQIRFEIKVDSADSVKMANVMIGEEKPYFALPSPTTEYQTIVIDVSKTVKDPDAVKHLRIGMNSKGNVSYFIRNLELLGKDSTPVQTAYTVTPTAPAAAFLSSEALEFTRKPQAQASADWTLRNWKNEEIRSGKWAAGNASLVLDALPNGYYTLELSSPDVMFEGFRSFAVVPDPAKRTPNPDMAYALDSAQSWLARPDVRNPLHPENAFEIVSEAARRSGTQMVRERFSWKDVQPVEGPIDWMQYKTNANLLSARGVGILGMYHDAPKWTDTDISRLPSDLVKAYRFAQATAKEFKGQMTTWEFWNEQEGGSTSSGGWDYAAAMKASYLGFKAGNPDIPVSVGGFGSLPSVTGYSNAVMRSGTGEYFDIYNNHSYYRVKDVPDMLADVRKHLKQYGLEKRPIWFSEIGTRIEGSAKLDSIRPGLKVHSPDQEFLVAEFLPKMLLNMQFAGVTRNFFFVLPPYNEYGGNKDWGLMRRDYTVKPAFVAFSALTDRLGNATPEGEVDLGDGVKGFLFRQKNGSKTLAFWSISDVDAKLNVAPSKDHFLKRPVTLPKQRGVLKGVDAFGVPFETDGGSLTATRYPAYLDGVTGLKVSIPFQAPELEGALPKKDLDKTIIFQTKLSDDFQLFPDKSGVDLKKDDAKFTLQVWNLSDQAKQGTISISGGTVSGLPQSVLVPAFGKTEFQLGFTPEIDKNFEGELHVTGQFGGKKTTPLVIPIQSKKAMIERGRQVAMPQLLELSRWRKNAAGSMTISSNNAEKSLRFRTEFHPNTTDRWTYPEFVLSLPEESLKNVRGFGIEVKVSKASGVRQMLIMTVMEQEQEGGVAMLLKFDDPTEEWEERFVQFPPGADPTQIKQIRIGLNASINDIEWQIRNVRVFYSAE